MSCSADYYFVFWSGSADYRIILNKVLSYHNLFTKTFPFTNPITRSSFYDFSDRSQQQQLQVKYSIAADISPFLYDSFSM